MFFICRGIDFILLISEKCAKYKFSQLVITDTKIWLRIQRVANQNGLTIGLLLTYPKLPCIHHLRFQSDAG